MSGKISGMVWDLDLPHNEAFVLLALCDKVDHNGKNAYPGIDLLSWQTGYDERTVRRVLKQLEEKGVVIPRTRGAGFKVYDVDFSTVTRKEPLARKRGKPGPKTHNSSGQNARLNSVENSADNPVENLIRPGILRQFDRAFQAIQPDIIPQSDTRHLLLHEPSLDPSLSTVHDSAGAGPVENFLAVIEDKPRWTIASNDPGGLPLGVVRDLCGDPYSEPELKRLVGFLVDSSFSGLAFYQMAEVIRGRVNGKKINSVGYYFPEIRRVEQFCNVQLAKPERHALLAGSTPEQRWANEVGIVRRIVEQWRKG